MEFLMQRAATRLDFRCTCLHKSLAVLVDLFGAVIRHSRRGPLFVYECMQPTSLLLG